MKVFVLTNEQARHFYRILANPAFCPQKSMLDMRKITKVFDCLDELVKKYEKAVMKLQDDHEAKAIGDQFIIPPHQIENYENAKKKLDKTPNTFRCDRESLSFAEELYVKVPEKSQQPLGGPFDSRVFPEVEDALRAAHEENENGKKK